jgi:hypothetical protein
MNIKPREPMGKESIAPSLKFQSVLEALEHLDFAIQEFPGDENAAVAGKSLEAEEDTEGLA